MATKTDAALQGTLIDGTEMEPAKETAIQPAAIIVQEPTALEQKWAENRPAQAADPVMQMILLAVQQGNIEQLDKILAFQDKVEKREAKKAYDTAMAGFASEPKEIVKNKTVSYKTRDGELVEYDHASLDNVCEVVGAALSKHGLSFRWQTEQVSGQIKVTCFLQHKQGHGIQVSLEAGPDQSGKKNAIQSIGSTITYLQRYTLLAATGMATTDQDDDGAASGAGEAQQKGMLDINERLEWIANSKDTAELKKIFQAAFKEARTARDEKAQKRLKKATDQRQAELESGK